MKCYKYWTVIKMVHLKYPFLEIWCCHKHITQLPPSRLKFDTKLRKVFPNNLAAYALHKSFSQGKYCTQFCLFVLANQMQPSKLRFSAPLALVTLLKCLLQGSNVAKRWERHPQVGLSAQHCTSHCYRQNT